MHAYSFLPLSQSHSLAFYLFLCVSMKHARVYDAKTFFASIHMRLALKRKDLHTCDGITYSTRQPDFNRCYFHAHTHKPNREKKHFRNQLAQHKCFYVSEKKVTRHSCDCFFIPSASACTVNHMWGFG